MNPGSSASRRQCILASKDKGANWYGPLYLDITYEDGGYSDMFYNPLTDEFVVVSYRGTLLDSDIYQYNFKINWS
jgi:hypothetical protein